MCSAAAGTDAEEPADWKMMDNPFGKTTDRAAFRRSGRT
jgi:hypothetical protein